MTKYGRSPWIDRFPLSRVPNHPRQHGRIESPIVVIGAGLTGCATAYAFAAAGIRVLVLDADRIGHGDTAAAFGWLSDEPGIPFGDLEKRIGLRAARQAFQVWRRAALDFAALLRRLDVRCDLESQSSLLVATTPEQASRLTREHKARRAAGLDSPRLGARVVKAEAGIDGEQAIRQKDTALIDPYRASVGLAAAAAERGARFFERSPVKRITFTRKTVDIFVEGGGSIHANRVIVATGSPTLLFKALMRHFWYYTTALALTDPVPARIRQIVGQESTIVRDLASPPHLIRWVDGQRLLVAGGDVEVPARITRREREKLLVPRTNELMYELSTIHPDISGIMPAYGWDTVYARTEDGLPYIGPHRNFPHHLFAFGDASHGVTGAYLASRMLLRQYLGESDPADAPFDFSRHGR